MPSPSEPADTPLISVVMPVYNAEPYVSDAIQSILNQTYPQLELIIVDDGSTDGSQAVAAKFARRDKRIRPLSVPHGGTAGALNAGIRAAAGEFIAILDSDDLALPERLAVQLDWMQKTGIDLCGSCVQRFQDSHNLIWFPESHAAICAELLFRCALLPSTILARASVLKDNPYQSLIVGEDYELWTRLAPRYRLGNVPRILVRYRTHPSQKCATRAAEIKEATVRYPRQFFFTLFPDATLEDFEAVNYAGTGRSHQTLAQLERAGDWLVRLADGPDTFLRVQMARRWMVACRSSASLGLPCFHLFRKIAPQFPSYTPQATAVLWLLCAARVSPGSRAAGFLRWLRQIARGRSHVPA